MSLGMLEVGALLALLKDNSHDLWSNVGRRLYRFRWQANLLRN